MATEVQDMRQELEAQFGKVWNTAELQADFRVKGFCYGCVIVQRLSDNKVGTLEFMHSPRFYFSFVEDK